MKFIPSRDLRIQPGKVWKDLKKERELIITSHGRPVALMVPVQDDNVEETVSAFRTARVQQAIRSAQEEWARKGRTLTEDEIEREIEEARKGLE